MTRGTVEVYGDVASLGALLRKRRKALGLTLRELALRANVTQQWLVIIENGRVQGAHTSRLLDVAEALGLEFALVFPPAPEQAAESDADASGEGA